MWNMMPKYKRIDVFSFLACLQRTAESSDQEPQCLCLFIRQICQPGSMTPGFNHQVSQIGRIISFVKICMASVYQVILEDHLARSWRSSLMLATDVAVKIIHFRATRATLFSLT